MKKISIILTLFLTLFCFGQNTSYQDLIERKNSEEILQFIKENPKHPNNGKLRHLLIKLRMEENKKRKREVKTYSINDFREKIAEQRANYKTGNNVLGTEKPKYQNSNLSIYSEDDRSIAYNNNSSLYGNTSAIRTTKEDNDDVEILNHLFSASKNKIKAYIEVKNLSKCHIDLEIKGKKRFSLKIPAHEEGRILVPKGEYVFSGKICDKIYIQTKNLNGDVVVTLE